MAATLTLGDRIREARGKLTQDELADRIRRKRPKMRVSGVYISKYERNAQTPRLSMLVAIAEETGKPLDFFHVDDGTASESSSDEDEEDSAAMFRAAYHLERGGEYALADDLRQRARRSKLSRKAAR